MSDFVTSKSMKQLATQLTDAAEVENPELEFTVEMVNGKPVLQPLNMDILGFPEAGSIKYPSKKFAIKKVIEIEPENAAEVEAKKKRNHMNFVVEFGSLSSPFMSLGEAKLGVEKFALRHLNEYRLTHPKLNKFIEEYLFPLINKVVINYSTKKTPMIKVHGGEYFVLSEQEATDILDRHGNVTELKLHQGDDAAAVARPLPAGLFTHLSLKHLTLSGLIVTGREMEVLATNLKLLQSVNISDCLYTGRNLERLAETRLRELVLLHVVGLRKELVAYALRVFRKMNVELKMLVVFAKPGQWMERKDCVWSIFSFALENFPMLKDLKLWHYGVELLKLDQMVATNLKVLVLRSVGVVEDWNETCIPVLFEKPLPKLKMLDLTLDEKKDVRLRRGLNGKSLNMIFEASRNLKEVSLTFEAPSSLFIDSLVRLNKLECALFIGGSFQLLDMFRLVQSCSKLDYIFLDNEVEIWSPVLSAVGMAKFLGKVPRLFGNRKHY